MMEIERLKSLQEEEDRENRKKAALLKGKQVIVQKGNTSVLGGNLDPRRESPDRPRVKQGWRCAGLSDL